MKPDENAPRGLDKLFGMLPSFIKGHRQKKIIGKGKPVEHAPRDACRICGVLYIGTLGAQGEVAICPTCKTSLDSGLTAIITTTISGPCKYAFVRMGEKNADMAGKVVPVSPSVFAQVWQRYEDDQKQKTKN